MEKGDQVLLIDDLIATGGTAMAGIKLLERAGAKVVGCSFVIDLPELGGADKLRALGKPVSRAGGLMKGIDEALRHADLALRPQGAW